MNSTTGSDSTVHHSSGDGGAIAASWSLAIVHHAQSELLGRSLRLPPSEAIEIGRKYEGFGAGSLDDHRISRSHARIRVRRDGPLVLEDLGSQNGSYVNGARVHGEALLASGDIIRLGSILLLASRGEELPRPFARGSFVGMSPALAAVVDRLDELAAHRRPVALCGETGTGKAHLAELVHAAGNGAGELIRVSCASIPDRLVSHELFGYERGAFPGADEARAGLIASADGGTLVVEELADASPTLQGALIRFLDTGEIRRVGSDQPITVDARVIATAGAGLDAPSIRADLRSRLTADSIALPPLRARVGDATLIATHLVRDALGMGASLHWRTALALLRAPWPGNVRQLRQVVDRLVAGAGGEQVVRMSPEIEASLHATATHTAAASAPGTADADAIELPPRRLSKQRLRELLREHAGNVTAIASHLGIGRNTLYRWLKLAKLDVEDFRR